MTSIVGSSGGGSATKSNLPELLCVTSRSFKPAYACKIVVHCFGGGGGGGAAYYNMENGQAVHATGGGAGQHSCSLLTVDPSVTYTVTVGGSGNYAYVRDAQRTMNGSAGGTSSFAGSDIVTVSAGGGGGGNGYRGSGTQLTAGGTGGAGGAGNLCALVGGAGGYSQNTNGGSVTRQMLSTGGGAVNIYGNAFDAGRSYATGAYPGPTFATGGAGIGGSSSQATSSNGWDLSTRGGNLYGQSGGAAYSNMGGLPPSIKMSTSVEGFGDNITGTAATPDIGNNTKGSIFDLLMHMVPYNTHGIQPPGVGGRAGGIGPNSGSGGEQNVNCPATNASLFAGGGALKSYSSGVNVSNGGNGWGGVGGGGGGGQTYRGQNTTSTWGYSGLGGKGLVVIQFLEIVI